MIKRILITEDHQHSREGLRDTLLREGYVVETAADSWQAIRKIKESAFDIAIIDLDLATLHGVIVTAWDLVRIFRACDPAISIIVLGAEAENSVRAEAKQLGVSEVLVKPINPTQLKGVVKTLTHSSEAPAMKAERHEGRERPAQSHRSEAGGNAGCVCRLGGRFMRAT